MTSPDENGLSARAPETEVPVEPEASLAPRAEDPTPGPAASGPETTDPATAEPETRERGTTDPGAVARTRDETGSGTPDAPEAPVRPPVPVETERVVAPAEGGRADPSTPWRRLMSACKPRLGRAQLLAAVLCAVLGFALVVQLRQTRQDEFANLRQSDLVRILDDVTRRSEDLDRELSSLLKTEFELRSGTDSQRAALELAEQDAATQGILSGRLPAEGPGIEITIVEADTKISASRMFNVLEELRNAGAEVIEVNGIRMVTSSYFVDAARGVVIDGVVASAPYRWAVIGDPVTLQPAMEIPGGALPTIRAQGGRTTIEQRDLVEIKAVREPEEPEFATPGVDAG